MTPAPWAFEDAYQAFMAAGGFAQPCVSENYERRLRQQLQPKPSTCPHGRTLLGCPDCYFNHDRGHAI